MRTILITFYLLFCTCIFANEPKNYAEQNVIGINSTFFLTHRTFDTSRGIDKRTSIRILPKLGYFAFDNIQIGAILGYEYGRINRPSSSIINQHKINPSLFLSYHYEIIEKLYPYVGLGYGYTLNQVVFKINSEHSASWNYLFLTGTKYNAFSNVLICFEIVYEWNKDLLHTISSYSDGSGRFHSTIGEQLNIFIGIGIYL